MKVPPIESLEGKTVDELTKLLKKWGPKYSRRFEMKRTDDYMKISRFYISCSMMRENLENGWRRWWRITIPVTESRYEEGKMG